MTAILGVGSWRVLEKGKNPKGRKGFGEREAFAFSTNRIIVGFVKVVKNIGFFEVLNLFCALISYFQEEKGSLIISHLFTIHTTWRSLMKKCKPFKAFVSLVSKLSTIFLQGRDSVWRV